MSVYQNWLHDRSNLLPGGYPHSSTSNDVFETAFSATCYTTAVDKLSSADEIDVQQNIESDNRDDLYQTQMNVYTTSPHLQTLW